MQQQTGIRFLTLCVLCIAGCVYANTGDTLTMRGVIGIAEQNSSGRVTAVSLFVRVESSPAATTGRRARTSLEPPPPQYELYSVASTETGRELFNLIGETILAAGTVRVDKKGKKNITVVRYATIKSAKAPTKRIDTLDLFNE